LFEAIKREYQLSGFRYGSARKIAHLKIKKVSELNILGHCRRVPTQPISMNFNFGVYKVMPT